MFSKRLLADRVIKKGMLLLMIFSGLIVVFMAAGLFQKARPFLTIAPLSELLFSTSWRPLKGNFGFFSFIIGTFWVTGIAIGIAVPFCLLTAIYLTEYASKRVQEWVKPLIDLLAGIPSVVYGVWGVLAVVPFIKDYIAPLCGKFSTGYSVLAGGIVLAIMVFPIIIHVSCEVISSLPYELREASLALGATKWQTVKHIVLRKAMPGIIAAIVLGLSRAFGETMAVLMVVGNVARVPHSAFDPAYPLPALIANNYGEMLSIPLYDSALLFASLLLLLVVIFFNTLSQLILIKVQRDIQ
jgi:phosphate transport system permease protein